MNVTDTDGSRDERPTGPPNPENPIRQFWLKVLLTPYACRALSNPRKCGLHRGSLEYDHTSWYDDTVEVLRRVEDEGVQVASQITHTSCPNRPRGQGILRRLSHNTIDCLAGPVAKLTHSNSCIFFGNAVDQIMAYDNLATVAIQVLKYSTSMSFGVLVFVVLGALANPDEERVKGDGVTPLTGFKVRFLFSVSITLPHHALRSSPILGLAYFTGMLFRRYSVDLTPVIK